MTNERAIQWLEMYANKPVKWDDYSDESKEIREEAEKQIAEAFRMAIVKLKAQEPIRPGIGIIHNEDGSKSYFLHCPIDGTTLDEGDRYCRKCGKVVKWE